jgi:hypothetical protein
MEQLPYEVLELVLRLLPPRDLKAAVLVCRRWREAGEAPRLWAWARLQLTSRNRSAMLEALKYGGRFRAVRRLEVSASYSLGGGGQWVSLAPAVCGEEVLDTEGRLPGLRELGLQCQDLSAVGPDLLAGTVAGLEEVDLYGTQLTCQQAAAVFTAVCGRSQLKRLYIGNNDLTSVGAELLARAVASLEEAGLQAAELTAHQVETILHRIVNGDSRLKKLDLSYNDPAEFLVDYNLWVSARDHLEYLGGRQLSS